jgi:hypothetical protein
LKIGLPQNELVPKLKAKVFDFKKTLPIIISLRNPNLRARHYTELKILVNHDLVKESVALGALLDSSVNIMFSFLNE